MLHLGSTLDTLCPLTHPWQPTADDSARSGTSQEIFLAMPHEHVHWLHMQSVLSRVASCLPWFFFRTWDTEDVCNECAPYWLWTSWAWRCQRACHDLAKFAKFAKSVRATDSWGQGGNIMRIPFMQGVPQWQQRCKLRDLDQLKFLCSARNFFRSAFNFPFNFWILNTMKMNEHDLCGPHITAICKSSSHRLLSPRQERCGEESQFHWSGGGSVDLSGEVSCLRLP